MRTGAPLLGRALQVEGPVLECVSRQHCAQRQKVRHQQLAAEAVRHERDISNAGRLKPDFTEIDQCKPVLLGLSLAGNPVKPLLSLYGTEWRERGYGLRGHQIKIHNLEDNTEICAS